ncbi:MAG: Holliday junction branch migration protein RuvA [Gammaproteobacteria bacterium]|nr:Holliday junction branch migration protein RuvA [Gammaproteobacteria bacterium]
MIGRIKGQLVEVVDQRVLIDVGGVGYEVDISTGALAALPSVGVEVTLYTHAQVREDAQLLFGFQSKSERDLFRVLIRINGVGPKLALSVISSVDMGELANSVAQNDVSLLVKVPGIGRKTAARLLLDLKDRLADLAIEPVAARNHADRTVAIEARRALVSLGYKPADAARVVDSVHTDTLSTEEIVRAALQRIARQTETSA